MTDHKKIYDGISRAAWGYFLIYFNINLGTISILPTFAGYLLFLSAIRLLEEEERELSLLRNLGKILVVWHTAAWLLNIISISIDGRWQFVDLLIGLVNLYFHFQMLTNLASIAEKYQPEKEVFDGKLLFYRSVQTVLLTIIMILSSFHAFLSEIWVWISAVIAIICVIVGVCIMKALFDLRKSIANRYL